MNNMQKAFKHKAAMGIRAGMVHGKGTTTSDSVPTHLSRGEAVLPAKTVQAIGGQQAVGHLVQKTTGHSPKGIRAGGHYAEGGVWDNMQTGAKNLYGAAKTGLGGLADGAKAVWAGTAPTAPTAPPPVQRVPTSPYDSAPASRGYNSPRGNPVGASVTAEQMAANRATQAAQATANPELFAKYNPPITSAEAYDNLRNPLPEPAIKPAPTPASQAATNLGGKVVEPSGIRPPDSAFSRARAAVNGKSSMDVGKGLGKAFDAVKNFDALPSLGGLAGMTAVGAGAEGAYHGLNTSTADYAKRLGMDSAPTSYLGGLPVRVAGVASDIGAGAINTLMLPANLLSHGTDTSKWYDQRQQFDDVKAKTLTPEADAIKAAQAFKESEYAKAAAARAAQPATRDFDAEVAAKVAAGSTPEAKAAQAEAQAASDRSNWLAKNGVSAQEQQLAPTTQAAANASGLRNQGNVRLANGAAGSPDQIFGRSDRADGKLNVFTGIGKPEAPEVVAQRTADRAAQAEQQKTADSDAQFEAFAAAHPMHAAGLRVERQRNALQAQSNTLQHQQMALTERNAHEDRQAGIRAGMFNAQMARDQHLGTLNRDIGNDRRKQINELLDSRVGAARDKDGKENPARLAFDAKLAGTLQGRVDAQGRPLSVSNMGDQDLEDMMRLHQLAQETDPGMAHSGIAAATGSPVKTSNNLYDILPQPGTYKSMGPYDVYKDRLGNTRYANKALKQDLDRLSMMGGM